MKDWPKCTAMSKLESHLDGWQACLDEYGTEMYAAPNILRTLLIGMLPDEFENEINEKPHLTDYQDIVDWCKVRIEQKTQKMLADRARKRGYQPKINMVTGNCDGDAAEQPVDTPQASVPAGMTVMAPDVVNELSAALKQGNQTPSRATDKGSRSPRLQ